MNTVQIILWSSMKEAEAFEFFDMLFRTKGPTFLSRFTSYRILMDVHGLTRDEAYKHWHNYEQSGRYVAILREVNYDVDKEDWDVK